jgi:ABC-2 type transport system ATP-binding protein
LLRDPKLLLLDEPATGLDPAGMRDMRVLIRRLAESGMTVLLSSHLLGEVEEVCNKVAIVRSGRIVYEGTINELARGTGTAYRLASTDDARAIEIVRGQPGLTDVGTAHGRIVFSCDQEAAAELSRALVEAGVLIRELAPQTVTLEDLFFSLTEGDGDGSSPSPLGTNAAAGATA